MSSAAAAGIRKHFGMNGRGGKTTEMGVQVQADCAQERPFEFRQGAITRAGIECVAQRVEVKTSLSV